MRKAILVMLSLLLPAAQAADGIDNAWSLIKSLAGEWEGTSPEGPVKLSYQVISGGSAVAETIKAPDGSPFMMTIYHHDGKALLATHYCAGGNQPRMRAGAAGGDGRIVAFKYQDATNVANSNVGVMRDLTLNMPDANHLIQEWTSRKAGKDTIAEFRLERKK